MVKARMVLWATAYRASVRCTQYGRCGGDGDPRARGGLQLPPDLPVDVGQGSECEHRWQDPKGGDLYPATVKPWETVVEAGHITDVQIVCWSGA